MRKTFIWVFTVFLAGMIVVNPAQSLEAGRSALVLCANVLIPSLLPFFICANILIYSGGAAFFGRFLSFFMKPLFNVNGAGALALATGMISGYPSGAAVTCRLYDAGAVTRDEAHRLLAFTNNSGPLFIMGAVGVGIYGSPRLGVILYVSHVLAALLTGVVFRFFGAGGKALPSAPSTANDAQNLLGNAISDSVKSIINLCGYVVFFAVLTAVLEKSGIIGLLTTMFVGTKADTSLLLTKGLFEMATSISAVRSTNFAAVSCVLAVGGLSVLFQTQSFTSKSGLSIKTYIFGKLLCGGFSALITRLILAFNPVEIEVFAAAVTSLKIKMFLYYLLGAFGMGISIFALFSFISLIFLGRKR